MGRKLRQIVQKCLPVYHNVITRPQTSNAVPDLNHFLDTFRNLHVYRRGDRFSPHKPCMLLAVLGLAESGHLERNEIRFEPPLLERFGQFFDVVRSDGDRNSPFL